VPPLSLPYLPHVILLFTGGVLLLAPRGMKSPLIAGAIAMTALLAAMVSLHLLTDEPPSSSFGLWLSTFSFQLSAFGFLLTGLLALGLWSTQHSPQRAARLHGLLLFAAAGAMLTTVADNLILLAVSLELCSFAAFTLMGTSNIPFDEQQRDAESSRLDAGMSCWEARVLFRQALARQAVSAVLLLLAFVLLYVLSGTTELWGIGRSFEVPSGMAAPEMRAAGESPLGKTAFVLLFAAVAIRVFLVPFHLDAVRVVSQPAGEVAGVVATLPPLAAFVVLYRVGLVALSGLEPTAVGMALVLSGGTLVLAPCLAVAQTSLRRMFGYLVIGHAGVVLTGLAIAWGQQSPAALEPPGTSALARGEVACGLFLLVGLLSFAGLFALLIHLETPQKRIEFPEQLRGLFRDRPLVAVSLSVLLLNLVGIPPLPGFWARLSALASALSIQYETPDAGAQWHSGFLLLMMLMLVQTVVTAWIAFRLLSVMLLQPPLSPITPRGRRGALSAGLTCTMLTVLLGLSPTKTIQRLDAVTSPALQSPRVAPRGAPQSRRAASAQSRRAASRRIPSRGVPARRARDDDGTSPLLQNTKRLQSTR